MVLKQGLVYWVVPYQVAVVPVEAPGCSGPCYDGTLVYDSAIYLVTLL